MVMAIVGAALAVGVAPVAIGSFDGRWGASRTDLMSALPDIGSPMVDGEQRLGGDARILWIGGADVLPVAGLTLEEVQGGSGEGTVVALTDGRPTLIDQWSPGATEGMDEVRTAVRRALVGETHRLGAEVGRWSVARIVLVERSAPIPEPAVDRPVDDRIHAALARQLDLERVGAVNGAATVYRNTEVEAPFSVVRDGNRRVVPASVRRDALGSRTVGIQVDGALRWMHGPDRRWQVSVDGRRVPVLAPGTPTGVDDRPSIRVAAGSEARFELDEGPIRGRRRFQVAAAVGLLLLASWARTARRSHVGEGSW